MKKISLLILLLALGLVSCKSGDPDKEAAIKVVKGYTTALIQAYKDGNANYLIPFAGPEQTSYINLNIMSYKSENRTFISRIDELKIKDVKKADDPGEGLLVDTEEDWKFWMVEIGTGTVLVPETRIRYNVTYHLVKNEKSWIIRKIDLKVIT